MAMMDLLQRDDKLDGEEKLEEDNEGALDTVELMK
jgi:hypothetical protein